MNMSKEITLEDLKKAKEQFENLLVNAKLNIKTYEAALNMIEKDIAEFPKEVKEEDKMPEELKEVLNN